MTIQERILQYIEYKGITPYRFCKDLGLSQGYLDKRGAIGTDKYLKIIEYYGDISPEWLLTGEGEMLKSEEKTKGSSGVVPHTPQKTPENAPYDIKAFTDLISNLTEQNGNLREQLGVQANENRHLHEINILQATRIAELEQKIENLEEEVQTLKKESESIERIQGAAYPCVAEPTPASFVKKQKKTGGIPDFHLPPSNPKHPKMR